MVASGEEPWKRGWTGSGALPIPTDPCPPERLSLLNVPRHSQTGPPVGPSVQTHEPPRDISHPNHSKHRQQVDLGPLRFSHLGQRSLVTQFTVRHRASSREALCLLLSWVFLVPFMMSPRRRTPACSACDRKCCLCWDNAS